MSMRRSDCLSFYIYFIKGDHSGVSGCKVLRNLDYQNDIIQTGHGDHPGDRIHAIQVRRGRTGKASLRARRNRRRATRRPSARWLRGGHKCPRRLGRCYPSSRAIWLPAKHGSAYGPGEDTGTPDTLERQSAASADITRLCACDLVSGKACGSAR